MSESNFTSIEIDFEVYQLIILEKQGFEESDNDVLRRLLKLDKPPVEPPDPENGTESWNSHGVKLPEETKLKMTYRGTVYTGLVTGGKWSIAGKFYKSPSNAASVARTKKGTKPSLNGWKYWNVKRPSDTDWVLIDKLRHDNSSKQDEEQ